MSETKAGTSGIGFFSLLGLLFIVLKLCGLSQVASWSWWLVLLPIYGPWLLVMGFLLLVGVLS